MARAVCLTLLVLLLPGGAAGQTPVKPAGPPTLDTTPLPPDAIIVICENLGQAIGKMQPGSIILSPQRYQEMMEELARLRKQTQPASREGVMSVCRIQGDISRANGMAPEFANIQVDLEFGTERPGVRVPIPLRGLSLSDARLDNQPPNWEGSDGLVLVVDSPGQHRLRLRGRAPVVAQGQARKVLLEQLPPAAITSLTWLVPPEALGVRINGAAADQLEATPQGRRVTSSALGLAPQVEVSWKLAEPAGPTVATLTLTGEQRYFVEAAGIEADVRMKVEVGQGQLREMELALPGEAADLRVDLLSASGERLAAPDLQSTTIPRRWKLRFQEPINSAEPSISLRLRWQQPHLLSPENPLKLEPLRVIAPAPSWQSGTLQLRLDDAVQAIVAAARAGTSTGELPGLESQGRAFAFRYGIQPLEVQITPLPMTTASVFEGQWDCLLVVRPNQLRLECELEVTRTRGPDLAEVKLRLPQGWQVDSRLLLSPFVRDYRAKPETGELQVALTRRLPNPFRLRLALDGPATGPGRAQFELPILEASTPGGTTASLATWLSKDGKLTIRGEQVLVRLEAGTRGLTDAQLNLPEFDKLLTLPTTWQLATRTEDGNANQPTPRVALNWQPLLPEWRQEARICLTEREGMSGQRFFLRLPAPSPRTLRLLCPLGFAEGFQLTRWQPADVAGGASLEWRPGRRDESGKLVEILVSVPKDAPASFSFELWQNLSPTLAPSASEFTLEPPWVHLDPLTWSAIPPAWLGIWYPPGCKVVPIGGRWRATSVAPQHEATLPQMAWQNEQDATLPQIRIRRVSGTIAVAPAKVKSQVVEVALETEGGEFGLLRAKLQHLRSGTLTLAWPVASKELEVVALSLGGEPIAPDLRTSADGQSVELPLVISPRNLPEILSLELAYRFRPAQAHLGQWPRAIHAPVWQGGVEIEQARWRVEGLEGKGCIATGGSFMPETSEAGRFTPPQPRMLRNVYRRLLGEPTTNFPNPEEPSLAWRASGQAVPRLWWFSLNGTALWTSLLALGTGLVLILAPRRWRLWLPPFLVIGAALFWFIQPQVLAWMIYLSWPGWLAAILLAAVAALLRWLPFGSTKTTGLFHAGSTWRLGLNERGPT